MYLQYFTFICKINVPTNTRELVMASKKFSRLPFYLKSLLYILYFWPSNILIKKKQKKKFKFLTFDFQTFQNFEKITLFCYEKIMPFFTYGLLNTPGFFHISLVKLLQMNLWKGGRELYYLLKYSNSSGYGLIITLTWTYN